MKRGLRRPVWGASIVRQATYNLPSEFVGESQLAASDHSNGFEQTLRTIAFHDESTGTQANNLGVVCLRLRRCEDDGSHARPVPIQSSQDLETVEIWHKQVQNEYIRMVLLHHL